MPGVALPGVELPVGVSDGLGAAVEPAGALLVGALVLVGVGLVVELSLAPAQPASKATSNTVATDLISLGRKKRPGGSPADADMAERSQTDTFDFSVATIVYSGTEAVCYRSKLQG